MDRQDIESQEKILRMLKRRLRVRELQAAVYGYNVDPSVTIEIEDIKNKIADLEEKVVGMWRHRKQSHHDTKAQQSFAEKEQGDLIKISGPRLIAVLNSEIKSVSFYHHYQFFTLLTSRESIEIVFLGRRFDSATSDNVVDLRKLLADFCNVYQIDEELEVKEAWADVSDSPYYLLVFNHGSFILTHRKNIHNTSSLELNDFVNITSSSIPTCISLGSRGEEVFIGFSDGSLSCYNVKKKAYQTKKYHTKINCIGVSVESMIATGGDDGSIGIWSRKPFELRSVIKTDGSSVTSIAVNRADGVKIFASGHSDGKINIWGFDGRHNRLIRTSSDNSIVAIGFFSSKPECLVSASRDRMQIYNYFTGDIVASITGFEGIIKTMHIAEGAEIGSFMFDRYTRYTCLTVGLDDGRVYAWEIDT